jgi:23S rRNA (cytosine1962-C5)-methyltransferase
MDLLIHPFDGYELLDCGGERKLERFGDVVVDRPCPQAIWSADDSIKWKQAGAVFQRSEGGTGDWERFGNGFYESWSARWNDLSFLIRLTGFGNVGLFPEHTGHWGWMADLISANGGGRVLNLFAYTGGASMACARAGAEVTHVDSARSVNGWAMENAKRSGIPDDSVRYLEDDVLKFTGREIRRERKYEGIILDPPTFGRGPKGEVWKIERDFHNLVRDCTELLADDPLFVLLTSHSPGVTPSVLRALLSSLNGNVESGEMLLHGGGHALAAGGYVRWTPFRPDHG